MCRIVGFWDTFYKNDYDLGEIITRMRDTMTHGGPDDAGNFICKRSGFAIGHRRLSILDLSEKAKQPMEWQNYAIVYNGEVYNFREIREELEKRGYKFFSDSDTEVILKSFAEWGYDMVHKFRGMWAFSIWDKKENKLILCRDRVGVKPLYWYFKDGLFMFSSELKAFHKHPKFKKHLDFEALSLYFQYGYIPAPYSIFKDVKKLKPGHYLEVKLSGNNLNIKEIPYWKVEWEYERSLYKRKEIEKMSEDDIVSELESVLIDGFKLRLISDVPLGIFLSGGIDSSIVTTLLQKESSSPLKTFTIGFYEKSYNEAQWAKKVANYLETDHHELYLTPKDAVEIIQKLPEMYDEPFGDSSGIPTYLVSKFAKQHVKVALSADGGDEQFLGYTRYWKITKYIYSLSKLPHVFKGSLFLILSAFDNMFFTNAYFKLKPLFPVVPELRRKMIKLKEILKHNDLLNQYDTSVKLLTLEDNNSLGLGTNKNLASIMGLEIIPDEIHDFVTLFDIKSYLVDDILVKVDRASMAVSLEARDPFLDNKILELSLAIPPYLKWKEEKSKWILRKILYKYLPKELIDRPKHGFGVPIYEWFKQDLKELYIHYLNPERIKKQGLLNHKTIKNWLENYYSNKEENTWRLWLIFSFEMWKERWYE